MKLARDTWLIFHYETRQLVRNPVNIAVTLIQPITFLLLFTPFLMNALHLHGYGRAFQVYVPSLFAAMGIFSGLFAGFALLAAMHQGVIDRCRVTPLSRAALVLGRELMYVLLVGFQGVVVVLVAVVFGMRAQLLHILFAFVLLALMVLVSVSIGYDLALLVPNENSLPTLINSLAQPFSLLAGVVIPLSVAPLWVRHVALGNPFGWGTNGMRAIFQGHPGQAVVWEASVILAGVAVAVVVLSSRLFARKTA